MASSLVTVLRLYVTVVKFEKDMRPILADCYSRPRGLCWTPYRQHPDSEEYILKESPQQRAIKKTTEICVNSHAPDDRSGWQGQAQAEKLTANNVWNEQRR